MPDRIDSYKLVCTGGLNSNENHLDLSDNNPGAATRLVNYEPSLYGGYRRIEGFVEYGDVSGEVGGTGAEGKILGLAFYRNEHLGNPYLIAARKDVGTDTYSFYRHIPLVGWEKITTGLTLNTTDGIRTINKLRHVQFDFGEGSNIVFVDGINNAVLFDGTDWYQINNTNTGGAASPGGDQALNAPHLVDVFENHLFFSGDRLSQSVVAHSAPNDPFDFTAASGAGQISSGFKVVQIKPFRDNLFLFGSNTIKKLQADITAGFVIDQVTTNVGCVAPDSVLEIGGDLLFLAPDGLRPVAGTSRIGDVELETVSKAIQGALVDAIQAYDMDSLNGVVIRKKSQVRYFFADENYTDDAAEGIVGSLVERDKRIGWEFGSLLGIKASCCTSEYIGRQEYILHGGYDGRVYQQEQGNSFNGSDIVSVYATPYLDFGDTEIRKVMRKLNTFIRAEGPMEMNLSIAYDWGDYLTARPSTYNQSSTGSPTVFGGTNITYAGANVLYGGNSKPIMITDVQGSGFSIRATFVSVGQFDPYSIQGIVFEYSVAGRR